MVYLATILLASVLVPPLVYASTWNDPTSNQYHIQTDEGPERYFKYQTQNGQYRKEKRLEDGTVIGSYAWIDDNGYLRQRDYIADNQGYRIVKNKNIYVGRNINVGDAVKAAKNVPNTYAKPLHSRPQIPRRGYIAVTPKPIYSIGSVPPSVEISLNSFASTTPVSVLPESSSGSFTPTGTYSTSSTPSYLPPITSSTPQISTYVPSSTPSNQYIPSSEERNVHMQSPSSTIPPYSSTTFSTPISSQAYLPPSSSTPRPPTSTDIPAFSVPTIYIPPRKPSNVYIPTAEPQNVFVPSSTFLPPSSSFSPSSTPKPPPSSTPQSIHHQTYIPPPVSYIPHSSPRPFAPSSTPPSIYLPSTPSTVYLPSLTPEYLSITPPPKKYIPQTQIIDSNSLEYSQSPQYEHYPENFVNPYIYQNGPTYPLDTKGHSFNPTNNNIGNGYDPQYPYYDGISVTNDGFRYYIPRAYHEEQSRGHDSKSGSFGYIDPFGIRRVIYYNAGPDGFKHRKNNRYVGFNATPYDPRPY